MPTKLKFFNQLPIDNPFTTPPPPPTGPTITTQPSAATAYEGVPAVFNVVASGTGTLTYAWEVDEGSGYSAVTLADGVGGATATFTTTETTNGMDGYSYRVSVTDSNGTTVSNAATLSVLTAPPPPIPTITTQPLDATVAEGVAAVFSVVHGGSAPFTYAWEVVEGSGSFRAIGASGEGSGMDSATYTTQVTTAGMNGNSYRVTITNGAGSVVSSPATLTVTTTTPPPTGPTISTQPTAQSVTEPATATFSVVATGTGTVTYQWQIDTGSGTFVDVTGAEGSGGTTASFTTVATTVGMNGYEYRVEVTDSNGTTVSNAVGLTVGSSGGGAMSVVVQPEDQTVNASEDAQFSIEISGGTAPYEYHLQAQDVDNGNWFNITDEYASMSLTYTGNFYAGISSGLSRNARFIVTDSASGTIISNVAVMTVS